MRILIIGGSHAGISAAKYLKSLIPTSEVILIEQTNVLGFIPSSINFVFDQVFSIDNLDKGEVITSEQLQSMGITVLLKTRATELRPAKQEVAIQNSSTLSESCLSYDILILAMGSSKLAIAELGVGTSLSRVLSYKNPYETKQAYEKLSSAQNITIIGAGLIGLELATSLAKDPTKKITIVEQMGRPLFRYFDPDMTKILLSAIPPRVNFRLGETFSGLKLTGDQKVVTTCGDSSFPTDAAVLALNPRPTIDLIPTSIELEFDSTVKVNKHMQTTDPNIYAIGDLVKVPFGSMVEKAYLPLISIAKKTALAAARHISGSSNRGITESQRTIGTFLFGLYMGSTGITSEESVLLNIETQAFTKKFSYFSQVNYQDRFSLTLKIIYDAKKHTILGTQLVTSHRETLELITIFAQAISDKKCLEDLLDLENYYAPQLSPNSNFIAETILEALKN